MIRQLHLSVTITRIVIFFKLSHQKSTRRFLKGWDKRSALPCIELNTKFWYRTLDAFPSTKQERNDVLRLAYTIFLYFESIWNTLLAQCSDQPDLAMITYMSDGWARQVWAITKDSVNGISITHAQRVTKEYLLQRAILKVWNGSSFRSALGLVGARPLLDGKTAWEVYTSLHEFHKPPRFYNRGPCEGIYIFDGHFCGPLVRPGSRSRKGYRGLVFQIQKPA